MIDPLIPSQESFIASYARFMVDLSSLNVPQIIGATFSDNGEDALCLARRFGLPATTRVAAQPFDDIQALFDYYFLGKRTLALLDCASDKEKESVERVLQPLESHVESLLSGLPSRVLRCALRHDDLNDFNILLDEGSGRVTGVIDWEFYSIVPLCLAVDYPLFIVRDGRRDPRFADPQEWWLECAEESARLRRLFETVCTHIAVFRGAPSSSVALCYRSYEAYLKNATRHLCLASRSE